MGPNSTLARRFVEADPDGDLLEFCAPDCVVRQNGGKERLLRTVLEEFRATFRHLPAFHFEEPVVVDTENGFVEEHFSCTTLPDGTALRMPVVLVGVVRDGKIVSIHEYFDSAAAAPLVATLAG